ncbi:TPA: ankyrin repeat domain-containing protein [Escherichia coli]|nr:ankyrin repeat domain-containing protein [Escherichia coli]HEI3598306.1 ankyrin repeat domain-containing protein [Escherichia coli]
MKQVFTGCFIVFFILLIQGCKQEMNLDPRDYFSGQQLMLAEAIETGDINEVSRLAPVTDLNTPGRDEMTLLFWALGNSLYDKKTPTHLKIITLLVRAGADPVPKGESSPAKFALKGDSGEWIKAMLDGGLSPDARDKVFNKPIIFQTIYARNTETLKTMLDAGADINITNSLGRTLLFAALNYHAYDHVILLLERGADPEIRADSGWTMGNQLERFLNRAKKDSEEYKKLTEIKEKLIQHGGKWPPDPVVKK